jgi:hypothetical protein
VPNDKAEDDPKDGFKVKNETKSHDSEHATRSKKFERPKEERPKKDD